ncbi:hypothetical protein ACHABX_03610 [Nesterenkonia halotolerans]|uniref:hypothetical protein n=1 Tax=Nesterenkonia halotolerans TaxID=225325 RepID=UPI003EE44304
MKHQFPITVGLLLAQVVAVWISHKYWGPAVGTPVAVVGLFIVMIFTMTCTRKRQANAAAAES